MLSAVAIYTRIMERILVVNLLLNKEEIPTYITEFIADNIQNIIDHTMTKVYYDLYMKFAPQTSIRHNMVLDGGSYDEECRQYTRGADINKDDPEYSKNLYTYKKFRTYKDEQKDKFYKSFGVTPPKDLYDCTNNYEGHKLNALNFSIQKILYQYPFFSDVTRERISNVKKISNYDLLEIIKCFSSVNTGVYKDIMCMYDNCDNKYFMRAMNFFSLEINCHFEAVYQSARLLKEIPDKKTRDCECECLKRVNWPAHYQNFWVKGWKESLMPYYTSKNTVETFEQIFIIVNNIISVVSQEEKMFICDYVITTQNKPFFVEDLELSAFTEMFFKIFIGEGQHIEEKDWNEINLRDLRKFY